jgi:phage shock protein PspC (stress-responsive transcriptional regulator)
LANVIFNKGAIMKFKRINQHSQLMGVCAGLAYSLKMPVWIVRVIVLLLALTCIGIIPYLLVGIFAPIYQDDPNDYKEICE